MSIEVRLVLLRSSKKDGDQLARKVNNVRTDKMSNLTSVAIEPQKEGIFQTSMLSRWLVEGQPNR
jgi:hypothetical protein